MTKINQLNCENMNITKVRVGCDHSYFLDSEGSVWVCGSNRKGQLGLGHAESPIKKITCINFFVKHNIKMKEIEYGKNILS